MDTQKLRTSTAAFQRRFSKKWYTLAPLIFLVGTVGIFLALKTYEKSSPVDTKATVELTEKTAPAPTPNPSRAGANINKSVSPPGQAFRDAVETRSRMVTENPAPGVTHLTVSLDVLRERERYQAQKQRWLAQIIFSSIMGMASIYVVLSKKYPDDTSKWAYSTIAFILGFWLSAV